MTMPAAVLTYLPLNLLNPHSCTIEDLQRVAARPRCPAAVRAYIAGVIAGRQQHG